MKITTFILIISLMQVSAASFGQRVTLKQRGITLEDVFREIRSQTGYDVLVGTNKFQISQKIDANFQDSQLTDVMDKIVKVSGLSYTIEGKTVVIKEKETPSFLETVIDRFANIDVRGRILDDQKNPLPGATVKVKGTNQSTVTNEKGEFYLPDLRDKAVLIIAYVGYAQREVNAEKNVGDITLSLSDNKLDEVNVTINTGYQTIPKERATGSFAFIDNKLLNRSVSTNVLDRLEGVTSGVLFNKAANRLGGPAGKGGDPGISIRGRSTLFANTDPLVILDNFPYDGDLNNINPNDIESITVLKDAAAASIWGVRAGNGVIVLTSKKGKLNQAPTISLNSNVTVGAKPDLYKVPQMTSKEYIDYEKFLFDNGYYDFFLDYIPYWLQSPAVDILDNEKKGLIGHDVAKSQLDKLAGIDVRDDYTKYFLRPSVNQQYALNISGGSENNKYYISGGYDKNLGSLISDSYDRINLSARNTVSFFKDRLELTASVLFTKNTTKSNPSSYASNYPYEKLVDDNGNALPVIRDHRQLSKDALTNSNFLDWNYYPYNERKNNGNVTNLTDYRVGLELNYKLLPKVLDLALNYQYQEGNTANTFTQDQSTYATRLLINHYTQIDPAGNISYPVPLGSMVNFSNNIFKSNTGRFVLNYHEILGLKHEVVALSGIEVKDYNSFASAKQIYGYNEATAINNPVDYFKDFNWSIANGFGRVPYADNQAGSVDRFFSYFANASYTYDKKYMFSASLRKDKSNLFGVDANKKGVPLYSLGLGWEISHEKFYKLSFLPYLRLRLTDGFNGNLSKNLSAYTTAASIGMNTRYNVPQQSIVNPPNPDLSWERVHNINFALDFNLRKNLLSGSIEYFSKRGDNLIGNSTIAPQTGITQFTGNSASMLTRGLDVTLNSVNIKGRFEWTTNFMFSTVRDKITDYKVARGVNSLYVSGGLPNPIVGKPYSAIFAYSWAGLDVSGNPRGMLNGQPTTDYSKILNSTDDQNLKFVGTAAPQVFGNIRNNLSFNSFLLSFNIVYKLNYFFRRKSFTSSIDGDYYNSDFDKRWKNSGDENTTNVPALNYPFDFSRDAFYTGSEILVEKADHIRLQDIQLSYSINNRIFNLPIKSIRFYAYLSNLGIIWRANKLGLDPDVQGFGSRQSPAPRTYAVGLSCNF